MARNQKERLMLYVSKKNYYYIKKLEEDGILGFNSVSNKDKFKFGVALGLNNPKEFDNKKDLDRIEYWGPLDKAQLITIKLATAESNDDIDEYCDIEYSYVAAEQCANRGFEKLKKQLDDAKGDEELFVKLMIFKLDLLYENNVISKS
jgi:hypothetical protein